MNSPGDEPTILTRVPTELEASSIVEQLKQQGIRVTMTGGFTAAFMAEAPGDVQLVVRKADYEKAVELLQQIETDNEDIDWSQIDVGEPED